MVVAAKLTRLTYKKATRLHLVAKSRTVCSSRSRRPVRKLLDTPSYTGIETEPSSWEVGVWSLELCHIQFKLSITDTSIPTSKFRPHYCM